MGCASHADHPVRLRLPPLSEEGNGHGIEEYAKLIHQLWRSCAIPLPWRCQAKPDGVVAANRRTIPFRELKNHSPIT
jgi:hypothetical protein